MKKILQLFDWYTRLGNRREWRIAQLPKLPTNFKLKDIKPWLLDNRKIILPILSGLGLLFFIAADYEYYPWLSLAFVFVIMYYATFGILHIKHYAVERDKEGNLVMYDKRDREESSDEQKRKQLEAEKAEIEAQLEKLNQKK